jgi:hypothetical protein
MIAWLQAFLGFPPPVGIPSIANRLSFLPPVRDGSPLPLPARTCAYIKEKANRSQ